MGRIPQLGKLSASNSVGCKNLSPMDMSHLPIDYPPAVAQDDSESVEDVESVSRVVWKHLAHFGAESGIVTESE